MQRDSWHLGLLAREALRNVFGPGSPMILLVALAVLLGAGSGAYIALDTHSMRQEVDDLAGEGRNVLLFSALHNDTTARIERASCEALAKQHGVRRAGMLERAGALDVLSLGTDLTAQRASTTLFPGLTHADLLVGRGLSDRASLPFIVRVRQEPATAIHAGPYPAGLGLSLSVILPPRPVDTSTERCVVILDEYSRADIALAVVGSQLEVTGNPIMGTELLTATNDPVSNFLKRPSRWLPLLLGLLGAVATGITTRRRASEIAVYRMSGTSPTSVMVLLTFETLAIAGSAALAGTAASLALARHYLDPAVPMLWSLALAGSWAVGALAFSLDLAVRRPSDLAKDR